MGHDFNLEPYYDSPDFSRLNIDIPGQFHRLDPGQTQPDPFAERANLMAQLRAGGYGHVPSAAQVGAMQTTLNNVRSIGGINYGTPGSARTGVQRSAGGASPASLALQLRRTAARQTLRRGW